MPGSIILKPLEAKLTRNIASFGKMDPYCVGRYANTNLKGQICKGGAMNPTWSEAFIFGLSEDHFCFIEVKNKDKLAKDSVIGICQFEIEKLKEEKESKKWYNLYFNQKVVGEIQVEIIYTEQKYSSRVVIYTQNKKTKETDETITNVNKLSMTHSLSKHIPKTQESKSPDFNELKVPVEAQISSSKNIALKTPEKEKVPLITEENKQEVNDTKQKKDATNQIEQESKALQDSATLSALAGQSKATEDHSRKQKKKSWGLLKKIKKMLDNPELKNKKTQAKKEIQENNKNIGLQQTDENSVPLKRRKVIEEVASTVKAEVKKVSSDQMDPSNLEETSDYFILERKKPEKKIEFQNSFDFIDKENSDKMRGNYQTNNQINQFDNYEKNYKVYSESITRAKELVNKVKENYDSDCFQLHTRRREFNSNDIPEFNSQERGIYVEDLSQSDKKGFSLGRETQDEKPHLSNYSQSVGEVLLRQNLKYR